MMENEKNATELTEEELSEVSGGHAISRSIYDPRSGRSTEIKCRKCGRPVRVLNGTETALCMRCR